jgi:putative FmdB family regulatory protein
MPIYEFRCEKCALVFEHLAMGQGDMVEVVCPACKSEEITRVMSTCSSVVNGSSSTGNQQGGVQVENRSCGGSNSCTSITLPGKD